MWAVMTGSIAVVWIATLFVSALLFKNFGPDQARNLINRVGSVIAVTGMALGFLMMIPTTAQIVAGGSTVGAHTVGLADGGPGVPFFGWSTVGGDLRIPHFIGMHALQTLPILLILLKAGGRRIPRLANVALRSRLILVAALGYLAMLALLTWQVRRGQSIVHPDSGICCHPGGPRDRRRLVTPRHQNRSGTRWGAPRSCPHLPNHPPQHYPTHPDRRRGFRPTRNSCPRPPALRDSA